MVVFLHNLYFAEIQATKVASDEVNLMHCSNTTSPGHAPAPAAHGREERKFKVKAVRSKTQPSRSLLPDKSGIAMTITPVSDLK
ncbi:MAG: hypothetical protein HY064_05105 [Bacteroidetes bacterium]|nr:hypothetical protein [Bacteroidota bacterium]